MLLTGGVATGGHRWVGAHPTLTKAGLKIFAQTRGDFCPRPNRLVIIRLPISSSLELQTAHLIINAVMRQNYTFICR